MNDTAFNPAVVRILVIVAFLILSQFLTYRKKAASARPTTQPTPPAKGSPLELMRQAMLEARQQAQKQQSRNQPVPATRRSSPILEEFPMQAPPPISSGEQFEIPPSIQPESSFFPTLLLLALVGCLLAMAYMYLAR